MKELTKPQLELLEYAIKEGRGTITPYGSDIRVAENLERKGYVRIIYDYGMRWADVTPEGYSFMKRYWKEN